MCNHIIVGDLYTKCKHFHGRYFTGEVEDCGSPSCASSANHRHAVKSSCNCPSVVTPTWKVINTFHQVFSGAYDEEAAFSVQVNVCPTAQHKEYQFVPPLGTAYPGWLTTAPRKRVRRLLLSR